MTVYVDDARTPYRRMKMCHMIADTMEELLDMADKIGVDRKWFQPTSHPHFDICLERKKLAVSFGAVPLDRRGFGAVMKAQREAMLKDPVQMDLIHKTFRNAQLAIMRDRRK